MKIVENYTPEKGEEAEKELLEQESPKEEVAAPTEEDKKTQKKTKKKHSWIVPTILSIILVAIGAGCITFFIIAQNEKNKEAAKYPDAVPAERFYSNLTGEDLDTAAEITAPVYCIQTPNGLDGARPQVGLHDAGVIFEAIAERGVTRFAAIYQNPKNAIVGPIRSLRLYYLEWDTPFDCTIVHAGGADDAIAAVRNGYKHLNESTTYMYRGNYNYHNWNNLFTTPGLLNQYNIDANGGTGSNIKGFTRMNPNDAEDELDHLKSLKADAEAAKNDNTTENEADSSAQENAEKLPEMANSIFIHYGYNDDFNPSYEYDNETNTYKRSYGYGPHTSYVCPDQDLTGKDPVDYCEEKQLSPKVVVVMFVEEHVASDNYHESITTIGSGKAYIFQNGKVLKGTWSKASASEQIKFADESGAEIPLIPGQTWISAVPNYGGIDYK